jgi:hypothetical protein
MTGYVGAIENLALRNTYFRHVLFTAKHAQLTEGASTCPPATNTAAGSRAITWDRPTAANVSGNTHLPTPIGRRPSPARFRRFRHARVGIEIIRQDCAWG